MCQQPPLLAAAGDHRPSRSVRDASTCAADLVLWDYTSNDLLTTAGFATGSKLPYSNVSVPHNLQSSIAERLARRLLQLPSSPALMFLMLMRGFDVAQYGTALSSN